VRWSILILRAKAVWLGVAEAQSWAALASGTGGRWNQGEHMLARVRDSSRIPTNLQALLNQ
jgi:hypothetical protein